LNSIIDKAADALEAEIAAAQALLAQMRAHAGGNSRAGVKRNVSKMPSSGAKRNVPKKSTWTAARRARFRKTLAAKKAEATK
jgi:hypothetical protein